MTVHPGNQVDDDPRNGPPDSEERAEHRLGVYRRVAFFVNPTAGSPVGGAREILSGAAAAGCTMMSLNYGDEGNWSRWIVPLDAPPSVSIWARCDTARRVAELSSYSAYAVANIEAPEIVNGFCTPAHAVDLVGPLGGIITEATVPHADWTKVAVAGMPVWIEIDPNVAAVRDKGIQELVRYGRTIVGHELVLPAFFATASPWWDGNARTFETYWDQLREQWDGPFAIYSAENVPDWSVIK